MRARYLAEDHRIVAQRVWRGTADNECAGGSLVLTSEHSQVQLVWAMSAERHEFGGAVQCIHKPHK